AQARSNEKARRGWREVGAEAQPVGRGVTERVALFVLASNPRKPNSGSGFRPLTISARARPEPHASVHPSVPCPVLSKRLEYYERPMSGRLLGVAGLSAVQDCARSGRPAFGNHLKQRLTRAAPRGSV